MSKNISLTAILVAVLLLSSMASVALGLRFASTLAGVDRVQAYARMVDERAAVMNHNKALVNNILTVATEYSKKNAGMAALLQQYKTAFEQLSARNRAGTNAPVANPGARP